MKILIIEDERLAAEKLEKIILDIDPETRIMAKIESVIDAINWFSEKGQPDLIFMDIQLDDGICFEIFEAVKIDAPIIFTTAYDNYAIRAFQVNSIDYLLKPVDKSAVEKAINKFKSIFQPDSTKRERLETAYRQLATGYKTRFFVRIGNHYQSVAVRDIQCFYILERATFLMTTQGKKFAVDYSLDQVQQMVDPYQFFRINRTYLINIDYIRDIYGYSANRLGVKLPMMDHLDMIVSREKVSDFKAWLDR